MRNLKILFTVLFFLVIIFAGCEKNEVSSVNGPVENDVPALAKHGFGGRNVHAVYTLTNSASENEVMMFRRTGQGTLASVGSFSTDRKSVV